MGFKPVGTLYFYYQVNNGDVTSGANTAAPASNQLISWAAPANVHCGGGYEAMAGANFTGTNYQVYAVNDYSSTPVLIEGKTY